MCRHIGPSQPNVPNNRLRENMQTPHRRLLPLPRIEPTDVRRTEVDLNPGPSCFEATMLITKPPCCRVNKNVTMAEMYF